MAQGARHEFRRRGSRVALIGWAIGLASLFGAPAGASAQAGAPTIVEPAPEGALKTGDTVRVRALHGKPRFRAIVDNRGVTGRFSNPRGALQVATLRRGVHLRPGTNRIVVRRGRGANRRHTARQFVLAKEQEQGALRVKRLGGRRSLRVLVRGPASPYESVRVRLNGKAVQLRDWMMGSRTRPREWPVGRRQFRASFGAADGLRYGLNRLRVVAWRADGTFDRVARKVRVPRTGAPLADAGRGRRVAAGEPVVLDGGMTRAPGVTKVRHRWQIASAPEGSEANLQRRGTARPRLVSDLPGAYRIRLTARASGGGGLAAIHETTVEATPDAPPIGVPIETINDDGAIEVGGKSYPIPGGDGWVHVMVFDRTTLELINNSGIGVGDDRTVWPDDAQELAKAIKGWGPNKLIVVSGGLRSVQIEDWPQFETAFKGALEDAGAMVDALAEWPGNWLDMVSQGHWSLIGVPGIDESAHQNLFGMLYGEAAGAPSKPGALTGYLQENANDDYTFASGNYVAVDTSAPDAPPDTNIIRVGSQHWTSGQVASGEGGFHMVVLNSRLQLIYEGTFITTGDDPQNDLEEMQNRLNQYLLDPGDEAVPGYLVIVQSIGDPVVESLRWVDDAPLADRHYGESPNEPVPRNSSVWGPSGGGLMPLAGMIGVLGGPEAHDQIADLNATDPEDTEGYSLIASTGQLYEDPDSKVITEADPGSPPLSRMHSPNPEAETQLPTRVVGTLSRDRQSLWTMDTPGLTGAEDDSLPVVAYQDPSEWPASSTDGERAANTYITHELGFSSDDLRVEYYEDSAQDWNTIQGELSGYKYPGDGHGFNEAEFDAVKSQLLLEVDAVSKVWALIGAYGSVFATSDIQGYIDLQTIAAQIEKEIEMLDSSSHTAGKVERIIGDSLWIADGVLAVSGQVELAAPVGALAGAFSLMSDLIPNSSGGPSLAPVEAEAGRLGAQVAQRYADIQSNIDKLGAILVSDWEKLRTAAANSENAWAWGSTTQTNVTNTLTTSSQREFWAALLSAVYGVYVVDPEYIMDDQSASNPWELSCNARHGTHPFGTEDEEHNPASWVRRKVLTAGLPVPVIERQWFGLNTQGVFNPTDDGWLVDNPDVTPQAFTAPLFARLGTTVTVDGDDKPGLGAQPLAFMADSRFAQWWFWCSRL